LTETDEIVSAVQDFIQQLKWRHCDASFKRLSEGRFRWWPSAPDTDTQARDLAAHQLSVLFCAGNPDRTAAAPDWRSVGPRG